MPVPGSPPPRAAWRPEVEAIVLGALEVPDPGARAAFVAESCGGDAALRAEVEGLLRASDAPAFLGGPAVAVPRSEQAGDQIGRYRLLQEIGQGGFGTVWMAEQTEPVTRRVALKVLKPGMDTREVVARFEQERQALAMMDHPNIAHVLDAGATASGRPFFVMELVRGMPITSFCDDRKLGTRPRLALFADLCAAIHHAHQKGIIHRDIKPSNVLVTMHGDKAVVKVIDFGIAKALQGRLTDKTLFTRFEQFVGTPVYMSPEQAVMSGLDVDTRSDIYALGILLYELLTGAPPFDTKSLIAAGFDEMRRIIREVDPPRPSSRLSTIEGAQRTTVAKARHVTPDQVGRLVDADLDWIVMKAIEKDRARRYETANAFLLDIRQFLADGPVSATPPSAMYRLRKFVHRHRTGVRVAVGATALLVGATAFSTWQALRATAAEFGERALRVEAERAGEQARRSEREARAAAARSARSSRFIQALLGGLDATVARDRDRDLVYDLLMRAGRRAQEEFRDEPEVEIEVLGSIVQCCADLGLVPHACEYARRAVQLAERAYGPDDLRTAALRLVAARRSLAQGRHEEARAFVRQAIATHRAGAGVAREGITALTEAGDVLLAVGDVAAATDLLREQCAEASRCFPADDELGVRVRVTLARAESAAGAPAAGTTLLREAFAACGRAFGSTHRQTCEVAVLLCDALAQGKEPGAAYDVAFAAAGAVRDAKAEHGEAAQLLSRLARLQRQRGEGPAALATLGEALAMARRASVRRPALGAELARDLAAWLREAGRHQEAEAVALDDGAAGDGTAARFGASLEVLAARLRVDPTDAQAALALASRQAWLGRREEWSATVRSILRAVQDTAHPPTAERAAKAAMLVPGADRETLAQARALALRALDADPESVLRPWFRLCAGMVEYRAGNHAAAESILSGIELTGMYEQLATVPIYRAMVALRQGRSADADHLLADAEGRMRPLPQDPQDPFARGGDHDDLVAWMAWREAQALRREGK